jgi:uncharacterized protein YutE (UPF0331/DUF86 family)
MKLRNAMKVRAMIIQLCNEIDEDMYRRVIIVRVSDFKKVLDKIESYGTSAITKNNFPSC